MIQMRNRCCDCVAVQRRVFIAVLAMLCMFFSASVLLQSQTSPYLGNHFIVAFPDTVTNMRGLTVSTLTTRLELVLFSFEGANATITGPTGSQNVVVSPDASQTVSVLTLFPAGTSPFVDVPGIPVRKSVDVRSDAPIFLYCRFISPFGSELFTPLPVEQWGREYRLAALRNDPLLQHVGINAAGEEGSEQGDGPGECLVIASEDSTNVLLTPTTGVNTAQSFVLNAGESVLIQTERPAHNLDIAPRDLSGSLIEADKPVAVLSGNTRTAGGNSAYRVRAPTTNSARNTLIEWLRPVTLQGQTFVYTPMQTEFEESEEMIRVVGTEPGVTTLTTSFAGPAITVNQGAFVEFKSLEWRVNNEPTPFVLRADKPALAYVITGSWAETVTHSAGPDYGGIRAWSPSMSLLPPVEEWMNLSRFHFFDIPATVDQYIVLVAEDHATVTLDGRPLDLLPVSSTGFKWGCFQVAGPGDHTVLSTGGKFGGILYGIRSGSEAYKPLRTEKGDDDPRPLHIADYEEDLSIAWSAPLTGIITEPSSSRDSITITSRDYCDSTVAQVNRVVDVKDIWTLGPLTATLDPGAVNVDAEIVPVAPLGPVVGYRIKFTPRNPALDASGAVTITGTNVQKSVEFRYAATAVTLPSSIDFGLDLATSTQYRNPVVMINRKPFTATVLAAELLVGTNGFSVDDGGRLPRPLQSGRSVSIDVLFTGLNSGTVYRDTLLVYTDCGVDSVPLMATTAGDPPPLPDPTITGYDWGVRPLLSTNDTLSFAGNDGTRHYMVRDVAIVDNPAGVFSLVLPRHANNQVAPNEQVELGIRFVPLSAGVFVSTILLITEDNDTVRAELRGQGVDTATGGRGELHVDDIQLDTVCQGDILDTVLIVRNPGNAPTQVISVDVVRNTNADASLQNQGGLPRSIPPGDSIHIPLRVVPNGTGPFEILLGVDSSLGTEGQLLRITGVAVECDPPALTVNDHDFGEIWITLQKEGTVTIKNVGRGDVDVFTASVVDDAENAFGYLGPAPPFVVPEGDSILVRVEFLPLTVGRKDASIVFETRIGNLRANLTGVGKKLIVPAFIRRDYHAMSGQETTVAVELDMPVDSVYPEQIDLTLEFSDALLDPLGLQSDPGVVNPVIAPGTVSATLLRSDQDILSAGTLFRVRFLTRLTLVESTELPFTLESNLPYVEFQERPGLLVKDPICGLEHRLFEFTRFGLSLTGPRPNPATDETTIDLEIPFDGQTTVVLYNLLGAELVQAVDEFLVAGRYTITIPLGTVPPGTYILRVRSGTFSFLRQLDILR